jgi:hypothetical protein
VFGRCILCRQKQQQQQHLTDLPTKFCFASQAPCFIKLPDSPRHPLPSYPPPPLLLLLLLLLL